MRRSAFAVLSVLAAAGCAGSPSLQDAPPLDEQRPVQEGALPLTRLRAEPYALTFSSGMTDSARIVVRDAETWRQVWSRIWRNHSPGHALPAIDFSREMVVVAALSGRPTGGYNILVESAYQRADHVEVVIRKTSPGRNCGTTQALTEPVDAARIPATTQPVRFRESHSFHQC